MTIPEALATALQNLEGITVSGYGNAKRLSTAIELVAGSHDLLQKQPPQSEQKQEEKKDADDHDQ